MKGGSSETDDDGPPELTRSVGGPPELTRSVGGPVRQPTAVELEEYKRIQEENKFNSVGGRRCRRSRRRRKSRRSRRSRRTRKRRH